MSGAERCVDCGVVTGMWVHGWDDKYRCLAHAANGPRPAPYAHHCPTCTCVADGADQ